MPIIVSSSNVISIARVFRKTLTTSWRAAAARPCSFFQSILFCFFIYSTNTSANTRRSACRKVITVAHKNAQFRVTVSPFRILSHQSRGWEKRRDVFRTTLTTSSRAAAARPRSSPDDRCAPRRRRSAWMDDSISLRKKDQRSMPRLKTNIAWSIEQQRVLSNASFTIFLQCNPTWFRLRKVNWNLNSIVFQILCKEKNLPDTFDLISLISEISQKFICIRYLPSIGSTSVGASPLRSRIAQNYNHLTISYFF